MSGIRCYIVRLEDEGDRSSDCFERGYIGVAGKVPRLSGFRNIGAAISDIEFRMMVESACFNGYPGQSRKFIERRCDDLHRFYLKMQADDFVLSPAGPGRFAVGRVLGEYYYAGKSGRTGHPPGEAGKGGDGEYEDKLTHRRSVEWLDKNISRDRLSAQLYESTKFRQRAIADVSEHVEEVRALAKSKAIRGSNALDSRLEDFLVENWESCKFGQGYEIYKRDGELVGHQYSAGEAGKIDILAISKDGSEFLVVEVLKDRAPKKAIAQLRRCMEFVMSQPETKGKNVRGCIVAGENIDSLRQAQKDTSDIEFYCYEASFGIERILPA